MKRGKKKKKKPESGLLCLSEPTGSLPAQSHPASLSHQGIPEREKFSSEPSFLKADPLSQLSQLLLVPQPLPWTCSSPSMSFLSQKCPQAWRCPSSSLLSLPGLVAPWSTSCQASSECHIFRRSGMGALAAGSVYCMSAVCSACSLSWERGGICSRSVDSEAMAAVQETFIGR
ncbi:unnamed protein product, partial [Coccothraustes coccothraustes]